MILKNIPLLKQVYCFQAFFHCSLMPLVEIPSSKIGDEERMRIISLHFPITGAGFENITSVTVFIESNIGGGDVTELYHLHFLGKAKESMFCFHSFLY